MPEKAVADSVHEEETLEELERQLASHQARRAEVQKFVDPTMKGLQTRWADDRIAEVEEKIRNHSKNKPKGR